jgi:hypothetical protein
VDQVGYSIPARPGAAPPVEHAGVDQFVEYRAELIQG